MAELVLMRGYPGSGKTTIARTMRNHFRVSRDDLRIQMFGKVMGDRTQEDAVTVAEHAMVEALLRSGRNVVVDACHVNPRYVKAWAVLAARLGVEARVHDVMTPLDECAKRDQCRADRSVGEDVITGMARRFPMSKWRPLAALAARTERPYVPNRFLPSAVMVDVDGTVAHMVDRGPFDFGRVSTDVLDIAVGEVVATLSRHHHIIFCSGRDDTCRRDTADWITEHLGVTDFTLLMRDPTDVDDRGNKRPDWAIKYDLFDQNVRDKYNVLFVLDDRNSVVDMWRRIGLKCFQVQEGDF